MIHNMTTAPLLAEQCSASETSGKVLPGNPIAGRLPLGSSWRQLGSDDTAVIAVIAFEDLQVRRVLSHYSVASLGSLCLEAVIVVVDFGLYDWSGCLASRLTATR